MRCPRCNTAIPIGGEMCVKCGCNVNTGKTDPRWTPPEPPKPVPDPPILDPIPVPDPTPPKPQPPKKHWFRRILITLLACLIGRYIGSMAGSLWARIELGDISSPKAAVQETVNPAFDDYLSQRGLSYSPILKKSKCVISELETGYFEVLEYGYSGDRLKEFYETIYFSMDGYSADEAENLKANARATFSMMLNPLYTTVEEEIQGNYLVIRIHYKNLDDQEIIQALIADGMVEADNLLGGTVRYISLEETMKEHLEGGGIQR